MKTFSSTQELYSIMRSLWTRIGSHEKIAPKLLRSRLVVRFVFDNPEGELLIDGRDGKELKVHTGGAGPEPDVEMSMDAEVANEFWRGRLNVPEALIAGRIRSRGPVHRALALLPALKPAFSFYPAVVDSVKGKAA